MPVRGGRTVIYPALMGIAAGALLTGLAVPAFQARETASGVSVGGTVTATDGTSGIGLQAEGEGPASGPGSSESIGGTHGRAADGAAGAARDGAPASAASAPQPGAADQEGQPGGAGLTETDRGVTAATIRLGVLLLQVSSVQRLGATVNTDPERQRIAWQAYIDEVNEAGGIHGRLIEPVYRSFDVLDANSMQAACLYLTQDAKVFAVVGQFNIPTGTVCITRQNETPFVSSTQNNPDEVYDTAGGRLFTLFPRGSRMMTSFAAEITKGGALQGRRLGVLGSADIDSSGTIADAMVEALRRNGADVVERHHFAADTATAQTQVPTALQKMRTARVDTIVWLAFTVTLNNFTQQADGQAYRPNYFVTDWSNVAQDSGPRNNSAGFDGATAVTFGRTNEHLVGIEPNAEHRRCREIYERRTGASFAETGSPQWGLDMQNCTLVRFFTEGAAAAGDLLTRPRFSQGMQSLGTLPTTNWGGGSFASGKYDFGDLVRRMRWEYECKCWKPTEQFHPPGS